MTGILEVTILGCGSSGGVPRADGNWGACDPNNPLNRRTRCSLLVRRKSGDPNEETTVLVDTSPDLARQTAAAGARRLDAVLLTHEHADQVHGIDDIRAFALRHRRRVPVYMDQRTGETMHHRFGYIFRDQDYYPAIADSLEMPPPGVHWAVEGPSGEVPVEAFEQEHGDITSLGFRFGPVAYSSDVAQLPEASFEILQGVKVWIVDALRETPHPTHAHLERTLEWIWRLKPERAILTNLHVDMDYEALRAKLPEGVEPAYDGLRFDIGF
jgi:phosphoribosyl 1,2-cyclic phosphate phosphodiesterase